MILWLDVSEWKLGSVMLKYCVGVTMPYPSGDASVCIGGSLLCSMLYWKYCLSICAHSFKLSMMGVFGMGVSHFRR